MPESPEDLTAAPRRMNIRHALLITGSLLLCILDFFAAPQTDPFAAKGNGYRHHIAGLPVSDPDFAVLRGWRRVRLNFRHFFVFWMDWPEKADSFTSFIRSDGNSFANNFYGHFLGSVILSLLGLWLSGSLIAVGICGTVVNIFHEYVAEGQYVDPSFIDLWLDQLGLLLAMAAFACLRQIRRRLAEVHRDGIPQQPDNPA